MALGAMAPVDNFGFVDVVSTVVRGGETGRVADGAVDVDQAPAVAADEVVVVVADPVLEPGRGARRLDPADETGFGEGAEGVVDRLARNGPDGVAGVGGDLVGGGVGVGGNGLHDGDSLSGDLYAVAAEQRDGIVGHGVRLARIMD